MQEEQIESQNGPETVHEPRMNIRENIYSPSRSEALRDYEVRIRFLTIGCLIEVGCMSIPFQSISEAMLALKSYTINPVQERQKWETLKRNSED